MISMTRALANELGPPRIRVNCVAPGFTPTPGSEVLGPYDPTRTPLGRVMRPDDLLGTFCYLLSDDSAFVSGQTIVVNGGTRAALTLATGGHASGEGTSRIRATCQAIDEATISAPAGPRS